MFFEFTNNAGGGPAAVRYDAIAAVHPVNADRTYIYVQAAQPGGGGDGLIFIADEPYESVIARLRVVR